MKRRLLSGILILLLAATGQALAQDGEEVTLQGPGPSGIDVLRYGLNTFDRTNVGARVKGMGGTGLALAGDIECVALNPAALAFLERTMLAADSRYRSGSASGTNAPEAIVAPDGGNYPISNYVPRVTGNYTYNNLAAGLPIVFFGRRAGVALAYRRVIDFRSGEESRFVVVSPFGEADFGAGSQYEGGVDAISPTFAVALTPKISVGATVNFLRGDITESGDQGVSTFGAVVARGDISLDQKVSGTSFDLGAQVRLTPDLALAGVLQPGYSIDFTDGRDSFQPLPDPTAMDPVTLTLKRDLIDHALQVPTVLGAGLTYALMDGRLTLAGDYWNRPWSEATIERNDFATTTLFPDTLDLSQTITSVTELDNRITKNAGFKDTSHFRLGMEYLVKGDGGKGVTIPLRIGFRREPMTYANIDSTGYDALADSIDAVAANNGLSIPERQAQISGLVSQIYHDASTLLVGDDVAGTTISLGAGIKVDEFGFDFAIARTSYSVRRIFLGSFNDVTRNFDLQTVDEDRSVTEMSFTASLRF